MEDEDGQHRVHDRRGSEEPERPGAASEPNEASTGGGVGGFEEAEMRMGSKLKAELRPPPARHLRDGDLWKGR